MNNKKNSSNQYVVLTLDEQRYALDISGVERIVRAAEITNLPKAPDIVLGVVNVRGQVIPVVNLRKRFQLPEREIDLMDQFIIARTSKRSVALVADSVGGVIERSTQDVVKAGQILPNMEYVDGVVKTEDGLILIHDLETFLSLEEERVLETAMESA